MTAENDARFSGTIPLKLKTVEETSVCVKSERLVGAVPRNVPVAMDVRTPAAASCVRQADHRGMVSAGLTERLHYWLVPLVNDCEEMERTAYESEALE